MNGPKHTSASSSSGEKQSWLDDTQNIDKIFWGVIFLSVILMLLEPFYYKKPISVSKAVSAFMDGFSLGLRGSCSGRPVARRVFERGEDYYDADRNLESITADAVGYPARLLLSGVLLVPLLPGAGRKAYMTILPPRALPQPVQKQAALHVHCSRNRTGRSTAPARSLDIFFI